MEQSCDKCGQTVEQGIPFCPFCSAPQIRVIIAEPPPQPLAFATVPAQDVGALPASQTVPVLALPMQWSASIRPCALASVVGSLLMYMGLNPFVAMACAGFLAVLFYRQRRPGIAIKATAGAGLGALSGLLLFAMSSVLEVLIVIFLHKGPEFRDAVLAKIHDMSSQTSDPQVLALFDRIKSPEGFEFLIIVSLIAAFVAAIVLGGIGGALGGAILGRRDKS
jgi:hypothetical protein